MALDADNVKLLEAMAAAGGPDAPALWTLPPEVVREAVKANRPPLGTGPAMHRTEEFTVPLSDGAQLSARLHVPSEQPIAVLVYVHGGGWVIEDIDGFDIVGRELAARSGAAVVLVNYRKAPEFPFPTPGNDVWDALRTVASNAEQLGLAGLPLLIGGDSAGGNLAAVTAQRARDEGGPKLAGQLLVYPVVDADESRPSFTDESLYNFLNPDLMAYFWGHYVPEVSDRAQPAVSPFNAESLADLPPALLISAGEDVLKDGVADYANALRDAGVQVTMREFEGQIHTFFSTPLALPKAYEAYDLVADWIRRTVA